MSQTFGQTKGAGSAQVQLVVAIQLPIAPTGEFGEIYVMTCLLYSLHSQPLVEMETGAFAYLTQQGRDEIEEKILYHLHEVSRLKQLLNASRPIMRLPEEILGEVFLHYQAHQLLWADSEDSEDYPCGKFYTWMEITHVCHRWREVALRMPLFWRNIKATRPEMVQLLLARSSYAPLHVGGRISFSEFSDGTSYVPHDA